MSSTCLHSPSLNTSTVLRITINFATSRLHCLITALSTYLLPMYPRVCNSVGSVALCHMLSRYTVPAGTPHRLAIKSYFRLGSSPKTLTTIAIRLLRPVILGFISCLMAISSPSCSGCHQKSWQSATNGHLSLERPNRTQRL